ncbi:MULTISPECIES: hypothetical protein [unclassified Bradyrhizobium]|uniref:hypothetical protein n=1 Tax=unclassified Bradyrhizobium TaxID=2631580 RepID=UPI0024E0C75C|nr:MULTISPECIES: hypothetical protein [unclassified Bradyrhizobium]
MRHELIMPNCTNLSVIPGRAQREPGIHNHKREFVEDNRHWRLSPHDQSWLWILGSRYARPGMTMRIWRCLVKTQIN